MISILPFNDTDLWQYLVLLQDKSFLKWVNVYAKDNSKFEKDFAKTPVQTACTPVPKKTPINGSIATPSSDMPLVYVCPVPKCGYVMHVASRFNPPVTAQGTVSDAERWGKPMANHTVKMRNHYQKYHPTIPVEDFPVGFAYVRSKRKGDGATPAAKKARASTGGTATTKSATKHASSSTTTSTPKRARKSST